MGVLLRQVLKTLCGVHHWSYAVFWKFGCNNPKLLIWEECHYQSPDLPLTSGSGNADTPLWDGSLGRDVHSSDLGTQVGHQVRSLVNKMMVNNQVFVLGEGVVGRAAFTGKHEWIIANNSAGGAYPPEVINEIHSQFSAGIQTIAVIPASPHGVVQLGSSSFIMEDFGFVNNVKSLILQLGCVPGALLSNNSAAEDSIERIGVPVSFGMPVSSHMFCSSEVLNSRAVLADSCSQQSILSQASRQANQPSQFLDPHEVFRKSEDSHNEQKISPLVKPEDPFRCKLGQVMPSNPDAWFNQQVASYGMRSAVGRHSVARLSAVNSNALAELEQRLFSDSEAHNHLSSNMNASNSFTLPYPMAGSEMSNDSHAISVPSVPGSNTGVSAQIAAALDPGSSLDYGILGATNQSFKYHTEFGLQNVTPMAASILVNQSSSGGMVFSSSSCGLLHMDNSCDTKSAVNKEEVGINLLKGVKTERPNENVCFNEQVRGSIDDYLNRGSHVKPEETHVQPSSSDDLYDVLGMDFKNKLLNGRWNDMLLNQPPGKTQSMSENPAALTHVVDSSFTHVPASEGLYDGGMFSLRDNDNLLDAVVSKANSGTRQSSDDNLSSGTTITKISTSSIPARSPSFSQVNMSDQLKRRSFDAPKTLGKAGAIESGSFRSGSSKDDMGSCSQTTSIYGSPLSSLVGHNVRHDGTDSAGYSKKKEETNKSNRKRLKPGENPRPRPKDRQMIQDRVKELREIVPNGAKCSIDALLERTIKHMLFMQSVMKHADKLNQTWESKIFNKDSGLVLKDNFDGGATWAFEVGSQSMVCPIIVEDLNPPRQLLVEMLCEERGFFLEIADLIRGLGLTILKGVMEARNKKIWARFAVEADRDVTRMEIFMSLVRLLEQTAKGSTSSSTNPLESNMMVHHALPQVTSIPVTGGPSSLQ